MHNEPAPAVAVRALAPIGGSTPFQAANDSDKAAHLTAAKAIGAVAAALLAKHHVDELIIHPGSGGLFALALLRNDNAATTVADSDPAAWQEIRPHLHGLRAPISITVTR